MSELASLPTTTGAAPMGGGVAAAFAGGAAAAGVRGSFAQALGRAEEDSAPTDERPGAGGEHAPPGGNGLPPWLPLAAVGGGVALHGVAAGPAGGGPGGGADAAAVRAGDAGVGRDAARAGVLRGLLAATANGPLGLPGGAGSGTHEGAHEGAVAGGSLPGSGAGTTGPGASAGTAVAGADEPIAVLPGLARDAPGAVARPRASDLRFRPSPDGEPAGRAGVGAAAALASSDAPATAPALARATPPASAAGLAPDPLAAPRTAPPLLPADGGGETRAAGTRADPPSAAAVAAEAPSDAHHGLDPALAAVAGHGRAEPGARRSALLYEQLAADAIAERVVERAGGGEERALATSLAAPLGAGAPATPTPTAPPPLAAPFGSDAWRRELGDRLRTLLEQNVGSTQLRLNPAHLGPLEVRISVAEDRASVWLAAQHPLAREALEAAAPRLRELLGAQGWSQVSVDVAQHSFGDARHGPTPDDFGPASADILSRDAPPTVAASVPRVRAHARFDAYA